MVNLPSRSGIVILQCDQSRAARQAAVAHADPTSPAEVRWVPPIIKSQPPVDGVWQEDWGVTKQQFLLCSAQKKQK